MSLAPGQTPQGVVDVLVEQAQDRLPPQLASVVALEGRPFLQGVLDFVAPSLAHGRALLLGDAAAVVRPHTAMGAAKAAGDALDLASLLQDFSVEDTLRAYNSTRLPIARNIARYGIALGEGLPLL
jgi:2-polyprenyl-6-methoxyphenol hydroxylase-like FAD-dependent oxidoreductase